MGYKVTIWKGQLPLKLSPQNHEGNAVFRLPWQTGGGDLALIGWIYRRFLGIRRQQHFVNFSIGSCLKHYRALPNLAFPFPEQIRHETQGPFVGWGGFAQLSDYVE